jgi:hypothetical protein
VDKRDKQYEADILSRMAHLKYYFPNIRPRPDDETLCREALSLHEEMKDERGQADDLLLLGHILNRKHDPDALEKCYKKANLIYLKLGDKTKAEEAYWHYCNVGKDTPAMGQDEKT